MPPMGLIGNVLAAVIGIPTSADRALLDTLCLASLADGRATDLELGHAREIALEMPGFRRKSRQDLQDELDEALAELRTQDESAVMQRIATSLESSEMREQAFALAAVIVHVDLDKSPVEAGFLRRLRAALAISEARERVILDQIEREIAQIRRGEALAPGT